ncbi:unnamed protein product [Linum tenue]|uniref:non-specific serine/threonine protein kinase n=4 Tax=Linum tenue TaxID=586396 RepID=A0AAV0IUX6_9ROSI|nr:unnamed protein product [Linum tenue]
MEAVKVVLIMATMWSWLLSIGHAAPLSFNYTSFEQCTDAVKLVGDATCVKSGVQVTGFQYYTAGQAQYSKPMRLWDASNGKLSNFTTTFTFSMDNSNGDWTCDGFAFFIASHNYTFPGTSANTGLLGLMDGNHTYNASANPFLAVEFDTYNNPDWDVWSNLSHVGVDLNSIQSVASKRWKSYSDGSTTMWAQISYEAGNLCANFTGLTENLTEVPRDSLCYEVDLRDYLAEWAVVGFSGSTAWRYQSHTLKSWSFVSDLDAEGGPTTTTGSSGTVGKKKKSKATMIVGSSVAGVVGFVGIVALIFWRPWQHRNNVKQPLPSAPLANGMNKVEENSSNNNHGIKFYSPLDIRKATKEFSRSEHLGSGGYGVVYRGKFQGSSELVAVKRISGQKDSDFKGYMSELSTISQLNHENLVKLMGWSFENDKGSFYLIYEYMAEGSLDGHLIRHQGDDKDDARSNKQRKKRLDWKKRYTIAGDVARGLTHLHEGQGGRIVLHGDIKPSNILLDSNFNAKLGDFGLALIVDQQAAGPQKASGHTPWYVAPECAKTGKSTKESDIYSFGLVLLEIACGGRKKDLAKWVSELNSEGNILNAADPTLKDDDRHENLEMESLLMVGLHCAHPDPKHRPPMRVAMQALNLDMARDAFISKYPAPTPKEYLLFSPPVAVPHTSMNLSGPPSTSGGGGGSESPMPLLANAAHPTTASLYMSNATQTAPNDGGEN